MAFYGALRLHFYDDAEVLDGAYVVEGIAAYGDSIGAEAGLQWAKFASRTMFV